ncbi:MAG: hypothetical protein QNK34_05125 [Woeseiaceae bacterium]|nr:hypothetical protein [Woeseiaceae bacterium]
MLENRITDPQKVSREHLNEVLGRGVNPTIQFSNPGYSPRLLKKVNKLCAEYGDKLEVRFYGHDSGAFDASILEFLPDAQWLSVDCLMSIDNEGAIASLPNLRKLSFGVYHFDNPSFLATLNLAQISRLALSDVKKKNFDLSPLAQCVELEEFFLNDHIRNIAAISHLPNLTRLSLGSIAKRQTLEFVNEIPKLEKLTIVLGGRENIDEVEHPSLSELEILRVRAINDLGDLSRFPSLCRLHIEDQLQLRSISFIGSDLEEVSVHNCKNLEQLDGLLELKHLREFRTSQTKLDFDSLLEANWPASMKSVAIYSGSEKWNRRARQVLDERGYGEIFQKN